MWSLKFTLLVILLISSCWAAPQLPQITNEDYKKTITEVFGESSVPAEEMENSNTPKRPVDTSQPCGFDCECVPYYLCKPEDQTWNMTLSKLFNDRHKEKVNTDDSRIPILTCPDVLNVCCKRTEIISPPKNPEAMKKTCGKRNIDGVGEKVVDDGNANESKFGEFPWTVSILTLKKVNGNFDITYKCSGSLIHPDIVLTAAHCVHDFKPSDVKIRAGEWDAISTREILPHQEREVVKLIIHENFTLGNLYNDFALLFLNESIDLNYENVGVVCLPRIIDRFEHSRCFVSGWGKDSFGRYHAILQRIEIPVVPRESCQSALRTTKLGEYFQLDGSFICAGGESSRDTCQGDGGAPLVCPFKDNSGKYVQAGIVSWGMDCGVDQLPGVYANVVAGTDWIFRQAILYDYNLIEYQHI